MDAWILLVLGAVLIYITVAKKNGRMMIPLLLRVIGIILIGYGLNQYIQGVI